MNQINLEPIWIALENYRASLIPEGKESHDEEWDEICSQMAYIEEPLNEEN